MALYEYKIGTTLGGMVNVEALGGGSYDAPKSQWWPSASRAVTDLGGVVQLGLPVAVWQFGRIESGLYTQLRTICPNCSALVYINTLKDDYSTYEDYQCYMQWPEPEALNYRAGMWIDFNLRFVGLVAQ